MFANRLPGSELIGRSSFTLELLTSTQPHFKDVKVVGALIHMAGIEDSPSYKQWLDMPITATTCKETTVPQLAMDYSQAKDYQ